MLPNSNLFSWKKTVKLGISKRFEKDLTQEDLSKISGVSLPIIINFEKERTNIKIENIIKILLALDICAADFDGDLNILNWEELIKTATEKRYSIPLTKVKLAALAEMCLNVVIDFEKGRKRMRLSQIIKILYVLGLTKSVVAGNSDNQGHRINRVH